MNFWLFLVLFWMLWMLVPVNKPRHVPHASQITTWGTIFTKIVFGVSKEQSVIQNVPLKAFSNPSKNSARNKEKKNGSCKAFRFTRKHNNKLKRWAHISIMPSLCLFRALKLFRIMLTTWKLVPKCRNNMLFQESYFTVPGPQ